MMLEALRAQGRVKMREEGFQRAVFHHQGED
jgi:hypothetical protein